MLETSEHTTRARQHALLHFLSQNTREQERALSSGDLASLGRLSVERSRTVEAASAFVPPTAPWDPELVDLAMSVRDDAEELQNAIRQCMAAVRKELIGLTQRQGVAHYLSGQPRRHGARWQG